MYKCNFYYCLVKYECLFRVGAPIVAICRGYVFVERVGFLSRLVSAATNAQSSRDLYPVQHPLFPLLDQSISKEPWQRLPRARATGGSPRVPA
jgi:hypothetical protein